MELTHNSNSSHGIGATTPTPIQWNWGDSKGFQCLFWNQLKRLKKDVNQVSLVVFFGLLVTPGWREGNSNMWNPLESPQFHGVGVGVEPPIPPVELELGHSKNQFQRIGIGVWNSELTQILFQWLVLSLFWCVLHFRRQSDAAVRILCSPFRFFCIDFWNAPIPTPRVEPGGQLQLQIHGIGGIPRDSTCLNFPLSIQVSLAVQKKPLVTPGSHLFSTFSTDFKYKHWNPLESPPILLNWSWSCSTNYRLKFGRNCCKDFTSCTSSTWYLFLIVCNTYKHVK